MIYFQDKISRESIALTHCLEPLLKSLKWPGERRHLMDALPFYVSALEVNDFIHTMEILNYNCKKFKTNIKNVSSMFVPALFISDRNDIMVILEKNENNFLIFDGNKNQNNIFESPDLQGNLFFFDKNKLDETPHVVKQDWFGTMLRKLHHLFAHAFWIGLFTNLLALSVPLFSMAVYNQVIATDSTSILMSYSIGIVIALIGSVILQQLQNKIFSHISTKINSTVSNAIFERLLFLPASYTESASISAQISRIRDFDNIQEFFSGPLISVLFDLPFVIIFLITMAILSGSLVFVPLVMIGIFALTYLIMHSSILRYNMQIGKSSSAKQELTLEALRHVRTLKYSSAVPTWQERYRELSAETAIAGFKSSMLASCINIFADTLTILTAIIIVGVGTFKILSGDLTVGALIAVMMLVWRILSPVKILFSNQNRINQFRASIRQINTLMNIGTEHETDINLNIIPSFRGDLRFNRVSIRYPGASDLALMNISFSANSKEVIAIVGRNGSGKSTLFKAMLGLYKPQAGSILIDQQDIRQLDPFELRNKIGYLPENPLAFYGSIALNLYLIKPTATEEELYRAIQFAGLTKVIEALPQGLDTLLDDQSHLQLPVSFFQRLSLASVWLKNPSIILMDDPAKTLDKDGEIALLEAIQYFRNNATIFIITHRPAHLKLADKILLLHEGQLLLAGDAKQTLAKLPQEFTHEAHA